PTYVRPDADLAFAAAELVDSAFFNAGQSCCAVERIYVHKSLYDKFVSKFVDIAKSYKLGDLTKLETTLGPVVNPEHAKHICKQVHDARQYHSTCVNIVTDYPNNPL
ncbi:Aldehyde/histidinol dehydrogenase, partial [Russula earlei]